MQHKPTMPFRHKQDLKRDLLVEQIRFLQLKITRMELEHQKSIAQNHLAPDKLREFIFALADANCWLAGYVAGGGTYTPDSRETLRSLSVALREIQQTQMDAAK